MRSNATQEPKQETKTEKISWWACMLDFGAPSPSQSLMTAGIWLGVFRTGASEGRRRKEERTEDSRGEKKVNSRTRRKRSKEGQLPPDSNTRPMPKKMSKQLREYVPEDKINDPPFLPRASLMKCVCVCVHGCSTFITYFLSNQTRRMSPGDFTLTRGFWKRGAKKVRNRAWKYYTRSVPTAFSETVSEIVCVFWNHLASNRRDGELDQRRAAAKISDTRGNNFMEVYSRHLQATQDSTDCRYSAPNVGCQLINWCQLMSIDVNCGMQTDFTRSSWFLGATAIG